MPQNTGMVWRRPNQRLRALCFFLSTLTATSSLSEPLSTGSMQKSLSRPPTQLPHALARASTAPPRREESGGLAQGTPKMLLCILSGGMSVEEEADAAKVVQHVFQKPLKMAEILPVVLRTGASPPPR